MVFPKPCYPNTYAPLSSQLFNGIQAPLGNQMMNDQNPVNQALLMQYLMLQNSYQQLLLQQQAQIAQ
jgi:hypothetical protein